MKRSQDNILFGKKGSIGSIGYCVSKRGYDHND